MASGTRRYDHKLRRRCRLGPSKNRRRDELLTRIAMSRREPLRELAADGAVRNVKAAVRQRCKNSFRAENERFERGIVRYHCQHDAGCRSFFYGVGDLRAISRQRLGFLPRPVENADRVAL